MSTRGYADRIDRCPPASLGPRGTGARGGPRRPSRALAMTLRARAPTNDCRIEDSIIRRSSDVVHHHLTKAIATSSRALASETSLCTSCRFDTSSPAPRWCATRSIRVILLHRRPHASPPCHLGTPPADHKHVRSPQAAGAYYAPAAYKVYEAESAVTAAEDALHALNARIKSVRDTHPTPSALGQISILPPVPRCAQYPSR